MLILHIYAILFPSLNKKNSPMCRVSHFVITKTVKPQSVIRLVVC